MSSPLPGKQRVDGSGERNRAAARASLGPGRYLFLRFGGRVVFLARFVAFLRSVAGLLAGANAMPWRRFVIASALGAVAWSATFGFAAYALGRRVEVLSVRAGVVVGTLVLLAAISGLLLIRKNRARLQVEADRSGSS